MSVANSVLSVNDDFPIRVGDPVHKGKVRSVYWLTEEDSRRLIKERNYNVHADNQLAVMIISDRISAFDCNWIAENGLKGIPGKGAALNTISAYWFSLFQQESFGNHHILEIPHPLVWIVQKTEPLKIEAIARQYITGSMWRAYEKGERRFCGIQIPDGLSKNVLLPELLITPSTKGIMGHIEGVPAVDDCSISRAIIEKNYLEFGFACREDIDHYEALLWKGFKLIAQNLEKIGQILVDTKFEFGYVKDREGTQRLIYIDEVGTPDSSRFWNKADYDQGKVIEQSKEFFRQKLLGSVPDRDVLVNSDRMTERLQLAAEMELPVALFEETSHIYTSMAENITGLPVPEITHPRERIIEILQSEFGIVKEEVSV